MSNLLEYNETTDLYLEILREAQKIEDKKLIMMIKERLANSSGWNSFLTSEGCEIIPFPGALTSPAQPTENRFWPKVEVLQMGIIFFMYLLLVSGHLLLQ